MKKITILLLCTTALMGQRDHTRQMPAIGVLQGVVLDSASNKPIEYASISIVRVRDDEIITGGVADTDGYFKIQKIPLGRYSVLVEFIGYNKAVIEEVNIFPREGGGIEQNLGDIKLSISSVQMAEVDVFGELPQFIQTIDKKIFFVDQSLTVLGGTATDALKKIPSVDVDIDGNISLRGDQNVNVLIDGKPSGLTHSDRRAMVDNIPAAMIDRVEVITNPSAKYDPDGMGGIINIILKRGQFEGMNGNTSITAGQFDQFNASGMLNFRREKFNVFSNASYRKGYRQGDGFRTFIMDYGTAADTSKQNTSRIRMPVSKTLKLGGDYYVTEKQTLSLSTTFSDHDNTSEEIIHYIYPLDYKVLQDEVEFGSTKALDLTYFRDYEDPQQKLELDISYSYSDASEVQTQRANEQNPINADEWRTNMIIRGDYTHPFSKGTLLETGFKGTIKDFNSDLQYLVVPYDFIYGEDVYAFYATLAYDFSAIWGLKLGLRAEQVETSIRMNADGEQDTTNIFTTLIDNAIAKTPFSNPYFKIYPSMFWMYTISEKDQLQFGYSKRVNRPRRWSMNPFPRDFFDTSHIRTGNPYVKPEFSDVMELNFSHFDRRLTLNTGVYYKKVKDIMRWWDSDFIAVGDTTYEVISSDNAGFGESNGIEFMVNYRPIPLINLMVSVTTWNSRTYGSGEADLNGTSSGYYARGMSTITLPRIARIELSSRYRGPMKFSDGDIKGSFTMDLAIQKGFLDNRLNLTFKVSDVFDSGKFRINTEQTVDLGSSSYTQIMEAERRRSPRTMYLTLSYNFGKMEEKKRWGRGREGDHGGGGMEMDY